MMCIAIIFTGLLDDDNNNKPIEWDRVIKRYWYNYTCALLMIDDCSPREDAVGYLTASGLQTVL